MEQTVRTRTRVPVNVETARHYEHQIYYPGTIATLPLYSNVQWNEDCISHLRTEEMTDTVTPQFDVLSGRGKIINSPMSSHKVEVNRPEMSIEGFVRQELYTSGKWYTRLLGEGFGDVIAKNLVDSSLFRSPGDISDDIARIKSQAVTKAWANIDSSEIYALVSVMESGKTVEGIADSARRLVKFLRNVKRLQLKDLAKYSRARKAARKSFRQIKDELTLSSLADRWMEIRYGWRPLYYDVRGAVNAFQKEFQDLRQTFRGTASDTFDFGSDSINVGASFNQPWAGIYANVARSVSTEVTCRAGVLCDVDLDNMDPWGFSKVPESALDLVPYSFVFGWFFNIADTLSAWTPNLGFKARASWVVTSVVTTQVSLVSGFTATKDSDTSTKRYTVDVGGTQGKTFTRVEETKTREPDPALAILPTLNVRINTAKLTDLVIMAKNLLYGGRYPLSTRSQYR